MSGKKETEAAGKAAEPTLEELLASKAELEVAIQSVKDENASLTAETERLKEELNDAFGLIEELQNSLTVAESNAGRLVITHDGEQWTPTVKKFQLGTTVHSVDELKENPELVAKLVGMRSSVLVKVK